MEDINSSVLITLGARIRTIRELLRMSQGEFGRLFNLKQGMVSQWEIGLRDFPEAFIEVLIKEKNVSEIFIRTGEGEPFNRPLVVTEPEVKYDTKIAYTQELVVSRYSDCVNEYMAFNHIQLKELAEKMSVNYTHLSTIVGKTKKPTIEILYKSYKAIGINPNYVIIGKLPKFLKT